MKQLLNFRFNISVKFRKRLVSDSKDKVSRQVLLNSRFNVIKMSDACLGFDMCSGMTPILLTQLLLACPDLPLERFMPMWTNISPTAAKDPHEVHLLKGLVLSLKLRALEMGSLSMTATG